MIPSRPYAMPACVAAMTRATTRASNTEGPPNRPAEITAANPRAEPTLMSMPPVSTTISSASVTTPMIDICSSRLVRFVPPQNTEPLVTVATRRMATRM